MSTSNMTWLLFTAVALGACGDPAARPEAAEPHDATLTPRDLGDIDADPASVDSASADPRPAMQFLVWTRDEKGHPATHRLDATGRELETIDGVLIATATGTWR